MLDFFGFSFSCFSAFCWDAINIPGKSLILLCPARTRAGTRTHTRTHARTHAPGALCLRTSSCAAGVGSAPPSLGRVATVRTWGLPAALGPLGPVVSPPAPGFPAALASQHRTPLLNPGRPGALLGSALSAAAWTCWGLCRACLVSLLGGLTHCCALPVV